MCIQGLKNIINKPFDEKKVSLVVSIRIIKLFFKSHFLKKCRLSLFLYFALLSSSLYGQYYQGIAPPFDISSGLPHNEINDIVKDQQGYIWIAT
ncbi:MAG: two-component regulator propeller domain-containing protein, partial [Flavobacteriia bacterium]